MPSSIVLFASLHESRGSQKPIPEEWLSRRMITAMLTSIQLLWEGRPLSSSNASIYTGSTRNVGIGESVSDQKAIESSNLHFSDWILQKIYLLGVGFFQFRGWNPISGRVQVAKLSCQLLKICKYLKTQLCHWAYSSAVRMAY